MTEPCNLQAACGCGFLMDHTGAACSLDGVVVQNQLDRLSGVPMIGRVDSCNARVMSTPQ